MQYGQLYWHQWENLNKMKPLKFYNPGGKPITTSNYEIKVIKTMHGLRKQAIAEVNGRKYYRFV